uniref:Uncharacterized protein n=1 Tax=Molossus molossus TaxID=27622 RepID=A0A7J8GLN6_MOLMO|nr:hypothetical protein HJG59_011424 [Molossus molossus]
MPLPRHTAGPGLLCPHPAGLPWKRWAHGPRLAGGRAGTHGSGTEGPAPFWGTWCWADAESGGQVAREGATAGPQKLVPAPSLLLWSWANGVAGGRAIPPPPPLLLHLCVQGGDEPLLQEGRRLRGPQMNPSLAGPLFAEGLLEQRVVLPQRWRLCSSRDHRAPSGTSFATSRQSDGSSWCVFASVRRSERHGRTVHTGRSRPRAQCAVS